MSRSRSVRLWTVQAAAMLDGARWPLRGSLRFVDPYMLPAYRWMAGELATRVGPPPRGVTLPLWAWPMKPDLRRRRWLPRGTRGVRIEIDVDAADTLSSDFDGWHAVLNRSYLESSNHDTDRFERARERSGTSEWPYTPALCRRIEASWQRIFTRGALTQVVFWQLRRDQVVRIEPFSAR